MASPTESAAPIFGPCPASALQPGDLSGLDETGRRIFDVAADAIAAGRGVVAVLRKARPPQLRGHAAGLTAQKSADHGSGSKKAPAPWIDQFEYDSGSEDGGQAPVAVSPVCGEVVPARPFTAFASSTNEALCSASSATPVGKHPDEASVNVAARGGRVMGRARLTTPDAARTPPAQSHGSAVSGGFSSPNESGSVTAAAASAAGGDSRIQFRFVPHVESPSGWRGTVTLPTMSHARVDTPQTNTSANTQQQPDDGTTTRIDGNVATLGDIKASMPPVVQYRRRGGGALEPVVSEPRRARLTIDGFDVAVVSDREDALRCAALQPKRYRPAIASLNHDKQASSVSILPAPEPRSHSVLDRCRPLSVTPSAATAVANRAVTPTASILARPVAGATLGAPLALRSKTMDRNAEAEDDPNFASAVAAVAALPSRPPRIRLAVFGDALAGDNGSDALISDSQAAVVSPSRSAVASGAMDRPRSVSTFHGGFGARRATIAALGTSVAPPQPPATPPADDGATSSSDDDGAGRVLRRTEDSDAAVSDLYARQAVRRAARAAASLVATEADNRRQRDIEAVRALFDGMSRSELEGLFSSCVGDLARELDLPGFRRMILHVLGPRAGGRYPESRINELFAFFDINGTRGVSFVEFMLTVCDCTLTPLQSAFMDDLYAWLVRDQRRAAEAKQQQAAAARARDKAAGRDDAGALQRGQPISFSRVQSHASLDLLALRPDDACRGILHLRGVTDRFPRPLEKALGAAVYQALTAAIASAVGAQQQVGEAVDARASREQFRLLTFCDDRTLRVLRLLRPTKGPGDAQWATQDESMYTL